MGRRVEDRSEEVSGRQEWGGEWRNGVGSEWRTRAGRRVG